MKFDRTPVRKCQVTHLNLPHFCFRYTKTNANRSVFGLMFKNVSKRAINGRYHAAAQADPGTNVENYDRLGIRMADRWVHDPVLFGLEVFGEIGLPPTAEHSIDRINPYGPYELGNLRWADPHEQASNTTRGVRGYVAE